MRIHAMCFGVGLLLVATVGAAQTRTTPVSKHAWIIAGSAAAVRSHDDLTDQTQTSVSASPTALVFVRSRLAVGGTLTAGYSKAGSSRFTSYGIGPSARYYMGDSTAQWLSYVSASVFPQWGSSKTTIPLNSGNTTIESRQRNLAFDGAFGLTRILVPHVGVAGEAFYTRASRRTESNGTDRDIGTTAFGLRFGLSAFVY